MLTQFLWIWNDAIFSCMYCPLGVVVSVNGFCFSVYFGGKEKLPVVSERANVCAWAILKKEIKEIKLVCFLKELDDSFPRAQCIRINPTPGFKERLQEYRDIRIPIRPYASLVSRNWEIIKWLLKNIFKRRRRIDVLE